MIETRKSIKNYEWMYEVSNLWNIKSLKRFVIRWNNWYFTEQKILSFGIDNNWYCGVWLCKSWNRKSYRVHRLVAEAFIVNKENKHTINHKDWNKQNNRIDNLERMSYGENNKHSFDFWLKKPSQAFLWRFWKDHNRSKKVNQYTLEWEFIKTRWSFMDIQRDLSLCRQMVWLCCKWIYKQAYWYKRKFVD
jgi:hypothetical protein